MSTTQGAPGFATTQTEELVHKRLGWPAHLFVVCSSWFFLFWLIPYYDGLPEARNNLDAPNEKTRILGMSSIGLYEELHINRVRSNLWWTRDTDLSGRRRSKKDGKDAPRLLLYPAKTPGMSMMLGGLYWLYRKAFADEPPQLYKATYFGRVFGTLLPVWLTSLLFYLVLLRICTVPYIILAGFYVYLLGSTTLPYALTVSSHSFASGMLLVTFAAMAWIPRHVGWRIVTSAIGGFCVGMAFSAEYTAVYTGVFLGLMALLRPPPTPARFAHRPLPQGPVGRGFVWLLSRWHLLVALAASLVPVGAVLWYHKHAFGSYFTTPYHYMVHTAFRQAMERGGFMGYLWPPNFSHIGMTLFSPAFGLFFWTPFLLFFVFGLYYLWRRRAYSFLVPLVLCLGWWFLYNGMVSNPRGGWSVGPRYISNVTPFAMLAAVWGLDRLYKSLGNRITPLVACTAIWSIFHYTPASVLFPHLPTSSEVPQIDVVGAMLAAGLGPSCLFPVPPGWSLLVYGLVLVGVCLYILIAGFQGGRKWWGVTLSTMALALGLMILTQLPEYDYAMREARIDFIKTLIPPAYRWRW